jgi:hypothetical protein
MRKFQGVAVAGLLVIGLVGCTVPTLRADPIGAPPPEQPQGQSLEQACETAALAWGNVYVADIALSRGDLTAENWKTSVVMAQIDLQAILDDAQDDYRDDLQLLVDAALAVTEPEPEESGRGVELLAATEPFSSMCLSNGHEFDVFMPYGG